MENNSNNNKALEERRKNYNAILGFLFESGEFDANTKRIFTELCHKPVEKALYDAIVDGVTREELEKKDDFQTLLEKSAKLYYLHSSFNVKLDRARYMTSDPAQESRDNFLLNCIVTEMRQRRPELNDLLRETAERLNGGKSTTEEDQNEIFKSLIFETYQKNYRSGNIQIGKNALYISSEIDTCNDFDEYVNDLISLQDNRLGNRYSFNYLWTHTTGVRRAVTFEVRRPSKNELYIFCIGGAFDYNTFVHMKDALIAEINAGIYHNESQHTALRRLRQYQTTDDRDILLQHFLENINSRLEQADQENTQGTDRLPYLLLEKVDEELIAHHFKPLVRSRGKQALGKDAPEDFEN